MYIYHHLKTDKYTALNNLQRLSDYSGISYHTLRYWFKREKLERVERLDFKIIKCVLVKRIGSKK